MIMKISDIFIVNSEQTYYSKEELLGLEINKTFISHLAKQLDLIFLENNNKERNLCFVDGEQLRPEYKMYFSISDVLAYLFSVLKTNNNNIKTDELVEPEIMTFFCK